MKRLLCTLAGVAMLSACGGGGSSMPGSNAQPPVIGNSSVTFVLKVPAASKTMRAHNRLKRAYVSPTTQGLGINYAPGPATFSSTQLHTPNVSFDLSTCGTGCTSNADGSKTYALTAAIPGSASAYSVEIVAWDSAPVTGSFTGTMLSQQYIASQTIVPGSTSTTIGIALDAIPAGLQFTPVAGQSHVTSDSGHYDVIGNANTVFAFNTTDADGYLIAGSDPGAPTLSVNDTTGHFTVTYSGSSNLWNVQAIKAGGNASFSLTATPPSGSGLAPVNSSVTVTPVQEVWSSTTAGGPPAGLLGYAMYPPSNEPSSTPIDYLNISTTNYNIRDIAFNASGTIFMINSTSSGTPPTGIYQILQNGYMNPPSFFNATTPLTASGLSLNGIAYDVNANYLYAVDTSGGLGYGQAIAYSSGGAQLAVHNGTGADLFSNLYDVTVANSAADGGAIAGQVWVSGYFGIQALTGAPSFTALNPTVSPQHSSLQGLIFDSNGYLWATDGGSLYVYQITGPATAAVATQVATLPSAGTFSNGMGATSQGTVWIPEAATTPNATEWKVVCSPMCSISQVGTTFATAATNFSMVVVP